MKDEEKRRNALAPIAGKTGKVRKSRKKHLCVNCIKHIRPNRLYVERSVLLVPPTYPIRVAYCEPCTLEYGKSPKYIERSMLKVVGSSEEKPRHTLAGHEMKNVAWFKSVMNGNRRMYEWYKDNVWRRLRMQREWRKEEADGK